MPRVCAVCTHPESVEIEGALVTGTAYRQVAEAWGLKLGAVFRHARNHLVEPIQRRPCDICGEPLVGGEQRRHAGCRKLRTRLRIEREYVLVGSQKAVDAWIREPDARWSSRPDLRRMRQGAGLCVVCGEDRPGARYWCCSEAHEKLRRWTLRRVLQVAPRNGGVS